MVIHYYKYILSNFLNSKFVNSPRSLNLCAINEKLFIISGELLSALIAPPYNSSLLINSSGEL